ncbi:dTDP-4-dehydrorhamnose 3,5-epimerase family protein [Actinomadura sp. BRA 177]|nr:dTDP-4-dehydrorhamnose 3,5-epimerase family protein [Actinomadura sp. BRA 177]
MRAERLAVEGAFAFAPAAYPDGRGVFVSPYQESAFEEEVGHPLFPVAQASHSVSRKGVVRGLHYTATPPGCAKYVHCPRGRVLDIVLDTRAGSPTFGRWDSVVLDSSDHRAVYFPVGVAHMFVALEDETVMSYLLSREYAARNELAVAPLDPSLGLPLPRGFEPVMSARDRAAPTLKEAMAAGALPSYDVCAALEERFRRAGSAGIG